MMGSPTRTNLVVVCRNKLVGIDAVIPVLMELKAMSPRARVNLVFYDEDQKNTVQKNYTLWEAIHALGARIHVLHTKNIFRKIGRLARFLWEFPFKNNIVIKEADALPRHKLLMSLLRKIARVVEVQAFLGSNVLCCHRNLLAERMVVYRRQGRPPVFNPLEGCSFDYFLSSLDGPALREFYQAVIPEAKIIKAGYLRSLPQWRAFFSQAVERNPVVRGKPYFLYVLGCLERRLGAIDEPELIELLKESLMILKNHSSDIRTVFKPHAITDITRLRGLLDEIRYENYTIDYGHPMVLASGARFVFGNHFSTVMTDAYYLGKPVVEYSHYDPEFLDLYGGRSFGQHICDVFIQRDPQKLQETLDSLIRDKITIKRDSPLSPEDFPDTPREFYRRWEELLGAHNVRQGPR